jgi:superfamily II DNA or RNA helicase
MMDQEFGPAVAQKHLSENVTRNGMILADIHDVLSHGRTPIVLAQRREHVTALTAELEKVCPNVIQLLGAASKKVKQAAIERLKAIPLGESFVIVATGKYVGEGFDEPRLDTLFLVGPVSWTGTLQQYAGRLHREYDGKSKVIIYDYVDIHVPVLETMYHRRITGYASMGYQAMNTGKPDERNNAIFDSRSFLPVLEKDIYAAQQEIVIASPYLKKYRTMQMLKTLSVAQINGARMTVITRPAENYKLPDQPGAAALLKSLADADVRVVVRPDAYQKFAVIDQSIVWYGNINLLGYGSAEESIMRLEQREIGEELLRLIS